MKYFFMLFLFLNSHIANATSACDLLFLKSVLMNHPIYVEPWLVENQYTLENLSPEDRIYIRALGGPYSLISRIIYLNAESNFDVYTYDPRIKKVTKTTFTNMGSVHSTLDAKTYIEELKYARQIKYIMTHVARMHGIFEKLRNSNLRVRDKYFYIRTLVNLFLDLVITPLEGKGVHTSAVQHISWLSTYGIPIQSSYINTDRSIIVETIKYTNNLLAKFESEGRDTDLSVFFTELERELDQLRVPHPIFTKQIFSNFVEKLSTLLINAEIDNSVTGNKNVRAALKMM